MDDVMKYLNRKDAKTRRDLKGRRPKTVSFNGFKVLISAASPQLNREVLVTSCLRGEKI